jgi:hypothetical protein
MFVVFGFLLLTALFGSEPAPAGVFIICVPGTLIGLALLIAVGMEESKKQQRKQEYAELLAEFKQDGMNVGNYEKIVKFLNHGKMQGQLVVANTSPEEISRWIEVMSIRYYAILNRLPKDNSPALRSELLTVGRCLREVNSLNDEWSEQRLANDLAALSSGNVNSSSSVNVAAQIEKLGELYKVGVITQEEFDRGKALFLGSPPDIAAQTLNVLDGLHKLKTNGALSESEYNFKKWELLGGKNLNPK